jgi:hypothetical protein
MTKSKMPRVASVSFVGTLSTSFHAIIQLHFVVHVLVKLAAAPLRINNSSCDGHFDLVYEFVRNVVDYDKPKMMVKVSKFFDTIT